MNKKVLIGVGLSLLLGCKSQTTYPVYPSSPAPTPSPTNQLLYNGCNGASTVPNTNTYWWIGADIGGLWFGPNHTNQNPCTHKPAPSSDEQESEEPTYHNSPPPEEEPEERSAPVEPEESFHSSFHGGFHGGSK